MKPSELISRLNEISNTIAKQSVRGPANYILTSKEVSDYFDNIDSKAKERKIKIKRILKDE